jgi:methylenetetrahydrofolate dehydrogenase (NADP+)/methenyltetrahydrofolate cyclohydrolase
MAKIIDGKKIAQEIEKELKLELEQLKKHGLQPGLGVILVGENPASQSYVRMKGKACERLGLFSTTITLPATITQSDLLSEIEKLKLNPLIHGILVQLPLPRHIDEKTILAAVPPEKDVDGFHPVNKGKLLAGEDTFVPCTPAGIQELLVRSGFNPEGKHVVVVGRSQIVGLPLALLLMRKKPGANATVTVCHTGSGDLKPFTRQADILIAAIGKPEVITADMIREGCVIIDVGVNRVEDAATEKGYRLTGDVAFETVFQKAQAISPVPGGVGPMTIVMLLKNTIKAARIQTKL